jgi:hypothetical protein
MLVKKHSYRFLILAAFLMGTMACTESGGGGGSSPLNLTAIDALINSADATANGAVVAVSADTVPVGTYWVTQEVKSALRRVIAQAIIAREATTQATIDAAKQALEQAVTAFETAKQPGTKTQSPPLVDKGALNTAVTAANDAKSGVVVGASADAVPLGVAFVSQSAMNALDAAIAAAELVVGNAQTTQAVVDAQTAVLTTAVSTFNAAKGVGTNTTITSADKGALNTAVTAANAAKSGILVAASADVVAWGSSFVTQSAMDALNAAITNAEAIVEKADATQAEVDAQVTTLNAAVAAFNAAKSVGTRIETVELNIAITAANNAKSGVLVGASADAVTSGVAFVPQSAMNALDAAIAAAELVVGNAQATQPEIDERKTALDAAVAAFNAAKGVGTNTTITSADKSALNTAVTAANNAKSGVLVNTAAVNVDVGTYWTTQTVLDTLNTAIAAAQAIVEKADATQAEVDAQVTTLNAAVSTFNAAKQPGTKADKSVLSEAMTAASAAKSGIVVDTAAANVDAGTYWTTQIVLDTLNAAIADAQAIVQKTDATQTEVDEQVTTLNAAVSTFNAAKQQGTKTEGSPAADKSALNTAVTAANDAKSGVVIDTNAANVDVGTYWTTQAVLDTLNAAIADAQVVVQKADATQAEVNAQASALSAAVAAFNAAKQQGTKTGTIEPDAPALLIFNQGEPVTGTTTAVPALATTSNGADRLVFRNTNTAAQFPNDANSVAGNTVVYLNTPATGAFTFSARVKITALNGGASGGTKGVIFGALANPATVNQVRFVGVRMGADGAKRLYRSTNATTNSATGTSYPGDWDEEFILKMERTSSKYELGFYDAKDPSNQKGAWDATSGMIADVGLSASVYPGFVIGSVDVEISNVSVTAGSEIVFITPTTTASPWGVKSVSVSTSAPVGADDDYDYQSLVSAFPQEGVQLAATVVPENADNTAVTWSVVEGSSYATVSTGGLVTLLNGGASVPENDAGIDITVKAVSAANQNAYDEFKFKVTKTMPKVTSVTVSGPDTVMAGKSVALTAEVAPALLSQAVTWRVASGTGTATISADGVLSATTAGTVTVYATSVALGANSSGVESVGYAITITPYTRIAWWNFQTLPAGWTNDANYNGANTTYRDVNDEMDMVFLTSSRSQKIHTTTSAPVGSGFSDGGHTSGGKNDFATISQVQGPFTIVLNYVSNNNGSARRPAIKINGNTYEGETSSDGDNPKTFTYTYTGTNKVDITLTSGNNDNPGRVYDIIIKDPSADLPIVIAFTDQGAGAFTQGDFTLSKSGANNSAKTSIIQLAGNWDSVQWYVDGKPKGTGVALYINAANYTVGGHTLSVEVTKNGVPWSKGARFTITQ